MSRNDVLVWSSFRRLVIRKIVPIHRRRAVYPVTDQPPNKEPTRKERGAAHPPAVSPTQRDNNRFGDDSMIESELNKKSGT